METIKQQPKNWDDIKPDTKVITQEFYDELPGNGAAEMLNALPGKPTPDGQPVLRYAKYKSKEPDMPIGIIRYWTDKDGHNYRQGAPFTPGMEW